MRIASGAAVCLSVLLIAGPAVLRAAPMIPLDPPVPLPDGSEFMTWEDQTVFRRTYVVNQAHPQASDDNPGTAEQPFRTINRAAQAVKAGERVVVHSGVYRELVSPKSGGKGPDRMIRYEAAPGAAVTVKGSRVVKTPWTRSVIPGQSSETLWMTRLPASLFEESNPFQLENASARDIEIMPWASEWSGRVPYTLRRGLVFQEGRRLVQSAACEDLVRLPGSYWVAADGLTLHVHPFDRANPNHVLMEATTQEHLFRPAEPDLGYIRVKGLTFMHAGNGFPRTGVGALFTRGGHHWIIEDNTVTEVNSVGIEIGTRTIESQDRELAAQDRERAKASPGRVIVRRNRISECGTGGIQGLEVRHALVENNHITHCGWQNVERYWETGAIKLLVNEKTLVRRNLIAHITAAPAIWLDWNNQHCRITQNLVYDREGCCNGAIFVEASQTPNMVDHNILWDIRGTAIYGGDTDNLIIAHNLVGPCTGVGVHTRVATSRRLNGRPLTAKGSRVFNNIILNARPIEFQDKENLSDYNVFADPSGGFDFKQWQGAGNDLHSAKLKLNLDFDSQALQLSWSAPEPLPAWPAIDGCAVDYHDAPRAAGKVPPGPIRQGPDSPAALDVRPVALP